MLIRATWTLKVTEPTTLPRSYRLEVVKLLHQRLGIEMGAEQIPSTTCSGILGSVTPSGDFVTFHPEEFYQLSLYGLREEASKAIADFTFPYNENSNPVLQLLGAAFLVGDRTDETTSYEELYTTLVANEPEPIRQFKLQFVTPTAFAQNRINFPLPVPGLLFRSWLERWNHFAPVYLGGDELIGYLSEAVAITRHNIQTRSFQVHQGRITGFVGTITLQVPQRFDPLLANVANLLVNYAQFCGTGMKTRLGMGQTQLNQTIQHY